MIKKLTALATLAAAGILAALAVTGAANAYTVDQLPGLGYSVSVTHLADGCNLWAAGYGSQPRTDLGSDCDPGFQGRVDTLIAATCPCAQTSTAAPTTAAPTATTVTAPPPPPVTTTVAAQLPAPPFADFTAAMDAGSVMLTDASTGQVASRVWQFGDGQAGLGATVSHPYQPGDYFVTLIVIDGNGLTALAVHELTVKADRSIALGPRTTQAVATPAKPAAPLTQTKPPKGAVTGKFTIGILAQSDPLAKYIRSASTFCVWAKGHVMVHVNLKNTGAEHVTVNVKPRYFIARGGEHGSGFTSGKDYGFDGGEFRSLWVDAGAPKGVTVGAEISRCAPYLFTIKSG